MEIRKPLLVRLWRKLFPEKPAPAQPVRLAPLDPEAAKARRRAARSSIESLEGRIAPAVLLPGGKAIRFTDTDHDIVTVTFSKAIFAGTASEEVPILQSVFTFSTGAEAFQNTTALQQLQLIDLTKLPTVSGVSSAQGVSMTVSVVKGVGGDGLTDIGSVQATGISLGNVSIAGDLGNIVCGSGTVVGLKSLTVDSLGLQTTTQVSTNGAKPDFQSQITGTLGSFKAGVVEGAFLDVVSGESEAGVPSLGKIGSIDITHGLRARNVDPTTDTAAANDGFIEAASDIGSIKIGSGVRNTATPADTDGIVGGLGADSGSISSGGKIASITINGDIVGGVGANSGFISSVGDVGAVKILGSVTGGSGAQSGSITSGGALGTVSIGILGHNSLIGGAGDGSGQISSVGNMGAVTIVGNIEGGTAGATPATGSNAMYSGGISAGGALARLDISGSIVGGGGFESGFAEGQTTIGIVKVGGSLTGGAGTNSGSIFSAGTITSASIGISLEGGAGDNSGSLFSATSGAGKMGAVVIGGAPASTTPVERGFIGGAGVDSGSLIAGDAVAGISVKGQKIGSAMIALQGGAGDYSGAIYSDGALGPVHISGDLVGGDGDFSASIEAHVQLKSLNLLGDATGGMGASSASIASLDSIDGTQGGAIGKITGGNFVGGVGANSAQIRADAGISSVTLSSLQSIDADGSLSGSLISGIGVVAPGDVGSIHVADLEGTINVGGHLGSLVVSSEMTNATVHVSDDLASLTVNGNVSGSLVTARGQAVQGAKSDLAIGKISITGAVANSDFLAGYIANGTPEDGTGRKGVSDLGVNGSAQIGAVSVGKTWTASDLVAGVTAGPDGYFGDSDDVAISGANPGIVARIASVVIGKGIVAATGVSTNQFGFDAGQIGSFKNGSATIELPTTVPANVPITGVAGVAIELV